MSSQTEGVQAIPGDFVSVVDRLAIEEGKTLWIQRIDIVLTLGF